MVTGCLAAVIQCYFLSTASCVLRTEHTQTGHACCLIGFVVPRCIAPKHSRSASSQCVASALIIAWLGLPRGTVVQRSCINHAGSAAQTVT